MLGIALAIALFCLLYKFLEYRRRERLRAIAKLERLYKLGDRDAR